MAQPEVWVFFYGSFINRKVLAAAGLEPESLEPARLWGYDIRIQPLANIVPSDRSCVFGALCRASHEDLDRLYGQAWVGVYLPQAVLAETSDGRRQPALCYISHEHKVEHAAPQYIERIAAPARQLGFPDWYLARIDSFRNGPILDEED